MVPCLNSALTLGPCLRSLKNQDYPGEIDIIVVDNGSTDDTSRIAAEAGVRVVTCPERGRGRARNTGAAQARFELLAFIDSDVVLSPTWLRIMSQEFYHPMISAGASRIIPAGQSSLLQDYRLELSLVRYGEKMVPRFFNYFSPPVLNSAAMMIRTQLFRKLGGFDESLSRFEDTDFSYRLFFSGGHYFFTTHTDAFVYFSGSLWAYFRRALSEGKEEENFFSKWTELDQPGTRLRLFRDRQKLGRKMPEHVRFLHYLLNVVRGVGTLAGKLTSQPRDSMSFAIQKVSAHTLLTLQASGSEAFGLSPYARVISFDHEDVWLSRFSETPRRLTKIRFRDLLRSGKLSGMDNELVLELLQSGVVTAR